MTLTMNNQRAIRNQPITKNLRDNLIDAVAVVYGNDAKIVVYSGGQDHKGQGTKRTGSVRHDGGRAADCYIYKHGRKLEGLELAKLGQYWLAKKLGACGLEMAVGGIHLDEWTTPPKNGGMFWTYKYSQQKPWGKTMRSMLMAGVRGTLPQITIRVKHTGIATGDKQVDRVEPWEEKPNALVSFLAALFKGIFRR